MLAGGRFAAGSWLWAAAAAAVALAAGVIEPAPAGRARAVRHCVGAVGAGVAGPGGCGADSAVSGGRVLEPPAAKGRARMRG